MTLKNCLERAKVFKEQGRLKESKFWIERARAKGYVPEKAPEKAKQKE